MKLKNKWRQLTHMQPIRMLKNKSVFSKYFITCAWIIFISFMFLGTILIIFSVSYSNSETQRLNLLSGRNIAKLTSQLAQRSDSGYNEVMLNILTYYSQIQTTQASGADIYIVDANGNLSMTSSHKYSQIASSKVPSSVMSVIKNNKEYSEIGTLNGFYNTRFSTVGVPITVQNNVIGAVFVSSKVSNLIKYIYDMIQLFFLCVIIALTFSFIIIYFMTRRLVKPLREMSNAAKSFAKGDFSIHVPVMDNDEVGQLAFAFNNMAASLSTLEDMRRNFVANVSHELKTPMTSIAGFIDGILDGTIPYEKQNYYLKIVSDEIKRLSRLVYSLLNLARLDAGEVHINYANFNVAETVRRVIIGFEQQIEQKHLEIRGLDFDEQVMVYSDPDLTHQIIYNLIENAVKFSNDGGFIEITFASSGHNKVYIGIKNSGIGISEKELPYIFDRFYKTDKSRGLDKKGLGLGLFLVKSILNLQGQDISVKSIQGEYCEFVITLKPGTRS